MNQNLAFTFLDIYFNPGFSFDKTILPGTTYCPIDPLNGFVKTDDILWFSLSQMNIPLYLNTTWEVLKPIVVDWFNDRFSERFGMVHSLFLFD
jgi:hypothetical protein